MFESGAVFQLMVPKTTVMPYSGTASSTQWAAVTTVVSDRMEPPQK